MHYNKYYEYFYNALHKGFKQIVAIIFPIASSE